MLPNAVPKPPRRTKKPRRPIRSRGRRRFPGREDLTFLAELRRWGCAVCTAAFQRQIGPTEVEHWIPKSRGGYDCGDTFPTCARHREERHRLGVKSFQARYPQRQWDREGVVWAHKMGRLAWL